MPSAAHASPPEAQARLPGPMRTRGHVRGRRCPLERLLKGEGGVWEWRGGRKEELGAHHE